MTSSLGRLFDAVAAITGVCRRATFDGHAASALEAAIDEAERSDYCGMSSNLADMSSLPAVIHPEPVLLRVSRETVAGVPARVVAARFHNTMVKVLAGVAAVLCRTHGLHVVCLGGGSFQNVYLRERLRSSLRRSRLTVFTASQVPVNDGGIGLGQAVLAASSALSS
jgi:hydrogenase maturation protein HypF